MAYYLINWPFFLTISLDLTKSSEVRKQVINLYNCILISESDVRYIATTLKMDVSWGWKKPNTFFAYIVFVNRFLHLCHYKTTFCQNNLSKSEDYFWNTYSMLQKQYALWVMAKIVAFLKNFQMLFEQNVASNVTRNQKLKHI